MSPDRPRHAEAARARRKEDLLLASALAREQAGQALDHIDRRVGRVEARLDRVKRRVTDLLGDGPPRLVQVFALPLSAGLAVGWWLRRRRRAPGAAGDERAGATRGPGLAWTGLLLAALPRLLSLWRLQGHGRRAWRVWRWWKSRSGARSSGAVRR